MSQKEKFKVLLRDYDELEKIHSVTDNSDFRSFVSQLFIRKYGLAVVSKPDSFNGSENVPGKNC